MDVRPSHRNPSSNTTSMPPPEAPPATGAPSRSAIVGRTVTRHHLLDVEGYKQTKELHTGQYISCPFSAAGRSWSIYYYPNGKRSDTAAFVSIFLNLRDAAALSEPVKALASFSLLDQAGKPVPSHTATTKLHDFTKRKYGFTKFINRAWLERSEHLKDDRFTIRCDVTVMAGLSVEERRAASPFVDVPPSELQRHLGDLLLAEKGADVTFEVGGETFRAHRYVLAARSAVFSAELFGLMKEGTDHTAVIHVEDMEAEVFRALLWFLYTDTLLDNLGMEQEEEVALVQHLLVAADRYNLDRLKLICEDKLCKHIDTASAASMLALADQHSCFGLKEACFHFLSFPLNLVKVRETESFGHLTRSCPSVLEELMCNSFAGLSVDEETKEKSMADNATKVLLPTSRNISKLCTMISVK